MSNSKKVLFVTEHNPFTNSKGGEQRSHVILNAFLNNGYEIDIAYIGKKGDYCPPITNKQIRIVMWGDVFEYEVTRKEARIRKYTFDLFPAKPPLEKAIDNIICNNDYTFIVARYIQVAGKAGLLKYGKRLILDIDDLPLQRMKTSWEQTMRDLSWKGKLYHRLSAHFMTWRIKQWIKNCRISYLPNEKQAVEWGTAFLPNIPLYHADVAKHLNNNKNILFIGILEYIFNYQAMDSFVEYVLPKIVEKDKEVKVLVAGKGLPKKIADKWKVNPHVVELGFIDDIYEFYGKGNIVICPLIGGAGTNIKVIEAMSMGKACVMTTFSAKGFEHILKNGENAYIVDNPSEYAEKILALIRDNELCSSIQAQALTDSREYYSQKAIDDIIAKTIQ